MTIALSLKQEILKEYDQGFTVSMLAKSYKIAQSSIYRWLSEEKNKKTPYQRKIPAAFKDRHKLTFREKRLIIKLKKEKKSYQEIINSLKTKVSIGNIYYYLKKAKLVKKRNLPYPSLENFEEYEKKETSLILKEYKRFSKEYQKLNREYRKTKEEQAKTKKQDQDQNLNKNEKQEKQASCHPNYYEIIYSFLLIFRHNGLFAKAVKIGTKILKRKTQFVDHLKSKRPFIEGEFHYHFGDCLRFDAKIEESEKQYLKAFEKFEQTSNYNEETIEFVKGACRSLYAEGDHNLSTSRKLHQILKDTKNSQIKSQVLGTMGLLNFDKGEYELAAQNFQESLIFKDEKNDEYAKGYLNLALCYKSLEEYQKAISCLKTAAKFTHENKSQEAKIHLVNGLAYTNITGKYKKAEESFLRARILYRNLKDKWNYLLSTCHLAKLYYKYQKIKKLALIKPIIQKYLNLPKLDYLARKYLSLCEL